MIRKLILLSMVFSLTVAADNLDKLYEDSSNLTMDDLVVDVKGYKVPTFTAFRGWVLLNNAEDKVKGIADYFWEHGISRNNTMP